MTEIGNILKEARENQELSFDDVFDILRIQPKFLKAIEEDRWEAMPSPAHVRGYVRKYAQHLSLDPNPLLSSLASSSELYAMTQQMQVVREPVPNYPVMPPQPETGTFFDPVNAQDVHPEEGGDWVGRVIMLAFVVAIGLLGWRFLPNILNFNSPDLPLGNMESLTETIGELLGREPVEPEPAALPGVQVSEPITTTELIVPTSRTNGGTEGGEGGENTAAVGIVEPQETVVPVIDPTRDPLPATLSVIDMKIEIIQNRTWIRVVADGITLFEGQANRGDVQSYSADESINIRTGNGAGVLVSIGDIDLGRMGERGEVVDRTWETTQ